MQTYIWLTDIQGVYGKVIKTKIFLPNTVLKIIQLEAVQVSTG